MKLSTLFKKYRFYVLSIIIIYLAWLIYSLFFNNNLVFPGPNRSFSSLINLLKIDKTYLILLNTFFRFMTAIFISMILGLILGILSGLYSWIEELLHPLIVIFRTLPLASIIIIILVIVGINKSPIVITCLMLVPMIYQAILEGVRNIDKDLMEVWKLDSKINFTVIRKVIIPQIVPFIKTAFIQAIGLGFKVLIMAEFICQTNDSIGKRLVTAKNNIRYDEVLAWSIILVILVLILEKITSKALKTEK